jgi:SAM-dependent methyltransferase
MTTMGSGGHRSHDTRSSHDTRGSHDTRRAAIVGWAEQLAAWAIPEEILAGVDESPWALPVDVFARRADSSIAAPSGASFTRALEALDPPGTVLDVGSGAGAASLPLAARCTGLTAVDPSAAMLDALRTRAADRALPVTTLLGRWPDVAGEADAADVVVCHHVVYNMPELDTFAAALTGHARRRVVLELTSTHPLSALNPLWQRMHGIARPDGPTASDAVAVLREAGIAPVVERWARPARPEHASFADLVAITRRRLCLPPRRDDELARALIDLGVDPAHPRDVAMPDDELVTLWWGRSDHGRPPAT